MQIYVLPSYMIFSFFSGINEQKNLIKLKLNIDIDIKGKGAFDV